MMCKSVKELPRGNEWLYEVKRGGQRSIAVKDGRQVKLFTEDGERMDYPEIEQTIRQVHPESAVVDGEIIALNAEGKQCCPHEADCEFQLYAWDLLHLNGRDLLDQPIERRKAQLCTATLDSDLLFSPSLSCEPDQLVEAVNRLSLEGVLAKQKGSIYEPGQCTGAWLKLRVTKPDRSSRASRRQMRRWVHAVMN